MSDWEILYDVHAYRPGLEHKFHNLVTRVTRVDADYLKVQYERMGYRVAFSMNQERDEDLFGEGTYGSA